MRVVHPPNYKDQWLCVNAIDENEIVTRYDLECLYAGRDLVKASMSKALMQGGNADEELEQRIDNELSQLFMEASLEEDKEKIFATAPIAQNLDAQSTNRHVKADLDELLLTALESETLKDKAFKRMEIDDECDTALTREPKRLNKKTSLIEERDKFKLKDKQRTKHLANLSNYNFKESPNLKIKAVIDFMSIQFTTDKEYNRSDLKGALTKISGHRYYVKQVNAKTFEVTLHDIKNKKDLLKRLKPLTRFNKSANPLDFPITCIERAIDFYADDFDDECLASLAIAMLKSLRLSPDSHSARLYRAEGETFKLALDQSAPFTHSDFIYHLTSGYSIGVNNEKLDDLYHHIYIKKTDTIDGKFTTLPREQWRVRCELRARGNALLIDCNESFTVKDLKKALQSMSATTKFVALKSETNPYIQTVFGDFPRLWGVERSEEFNPKRHKQPQLKRSVTTLRIANQVIANKQEDLAKKFAR